MIEEAFLADPADPAFDGHFPGDPLLPGVVLLDRLAAFAERSGWPVGGLVQARFLSPVRPGDQCRLRLDPRPGRLTAEVWVGDRLAVSALLSPAPS